MKYAFAAVLVLVALVTVFHAEKLVPVPRAIGVVMNSAMAKHMPFGIQSAYAESCIAGLEGDQDRVRYAVADATVRLSEFDRRIVDLRQAGDQSLIRIKGMVERHAEVSAEAVEKEVARHDDLQWKLTHAQETRDRLGATLGSLESAEGDVSQKLTELNDRLDIVQLDHQHNNAQELTAELTGNAYSGRRSAASHGSRVIDHMEHKERVREEVDHRYSPEPVGSAQYHPKDPWKRAKAIADGDC